MFLLLCEYCGNEHDGTYGSGRFCSPKCARKYSNQFVSEDGRQRQISTLNDPVMRAEMAQRRKELAKMRKAREKKERKNRPKTIKKKSNKKSHECKRECKRPEKYFDHTYIIPKKKIATSETVRIGKAGEYEIVSRFIRRGISVYIPATEAEESDLIAEFGGKLNRIQVKTTNSRLISGSVDFSLRNSTNVVSHGSIMSTQVPYSEDSVDYFALYDIGEDLSFLVKNTGRRRNISIREYYTGKLPGPTVNYGPDYEFDHVLDMIESGLDPDDIIYND